MVRHSLSDAAVSQREMFGKYWADTATTTVSVQAVLAMVMAI